MLPVSVDAKGKYVSDNKTADAGDTTAEAPQQDPMIAALLRERDGYVTRGLTDRVEQVDEQLALRGHVQDPRSEPPKQAKPAARRQQQTRD
jgi:hypothetical protein